MVIHPVIVSHAKSNSLAAMALKTRSTARLFALLLLSLARCAAAGIFSKQTGHKKFARGPGLGARKHKGRTDAPVS
jgi:hypothetical protein